jgi:hypothetical protein
MEFLKPSIIAREALMVLRNNAVLANLVHRDYSSEFVNGVGDTISIKKPATFQAKEFSDEIELQDASETSIPVTMNKLLDVSFAVTSEELTLDIVDFSEQLLVPAMQAFADKIDKYIIALEKDVKTNRVSHETGPITPADIIAARKMLGDSATPLSGRKLVIGTAAEADLLNTELFVSAEKVGDDGTALREASLGRKFGFDTYVDQNIEKEGAYTPSVAFHKNAFALVTRSIALPKGAKEAAIVNYDGFGLRVVYDYDIKTKQDIVSIDMLCGVATLDEKLAAVIEDKR